MRKEALSIHFLKKFSSFFTGFSFCLKLHPQKAKDPFSVGAPFSSRGEFNLNNHQDLAVQRLNLLFNDGSLFYIEVGFSFRSVSLSSRLNRTPQGNFSSLRFMSEDN